MNAKFVIGTAAASIALLGPAIAAADDTTRHGTAQSQPTGKQKATAIGAATGAVAGAVVGGPVGAVVGAGVGGYVGNKGTDANGRVRPDSDARAMNSSGTYDAGGMDSVKDAQQALEQQGYSPGPHDGLMGPNTRDALMRFQQAKGLPQSGTLDDATRSALKLQ